MKARQPLFPLVRHLSDQITPLLFRLPVSANQITGLSLLSGLAAAGLLSQSEWTANVQAAGLLVVAYTLDNCDGEIARLKGQCSTFGMHFDSFVDWAVHTAFFLGLGFGVSVTMGAEFWNWLGWMAAGGGTFNYALGLVFDYLDGRSAALNEQAEPEIVEPSGAVEWTIFVFRELSRADFCFMVLILALFDALWFLLPAGAVGAQVYWMPQFVKVARRFHV